MSERANERSIPRERSRQCGANKWLSGVSERGNGRTSGPVLSSRLMVVLNQRANTVRAKMGLNRGQDCQRREEHGVDILIRIVGYVVATKRNN